MIAVLFELELLPGQRDAYLGAAESLRPLLAEVDGFISIERFESISRPGRMLSLSFWHSEDAVRRWRALEEHRRAQRAGRAAIFADYRLTVTEVIRAYGMNDREQAPQDSSAFHREFLMDAADTRIQAPSPEPGSSPGALLRAPHCRRAREAG